MFKPVEYNLPAVLTGCTYKYSLSLKLNGEPKDLTNCTPVLYFLKKGEMLTSLSSSYIAVDTEAGAGTLTINIPPAITEIMPYGNIDYRIEIIEANGDVNRYMIGMLEVKD